MTLKVENVNGAKRQNFYSRRILKTLSHYYASMVASCVTNEAIILWLCSTQRFSKTENPFETRCNSFCNKNRKQNKSMAGKHYYCLYLPYCPYKPFFKKWNVRISRSTTWYLQEDEIHNRYKPWNKKNTGNALYYMKTTKHTHNFTLNQIHVGILPKQLAWKLKLFWARFQTPTPCSKSHSYSKVKIIKL